LADDILRADPRLRRTTLLVLGAAMALAGVGLFFGHKWLSEVAAQTDTHSLVRELRRIIGIALTGSAICLALLAWYAARKATQVKSHQQWPAPGVRVLRDTRIRRGEAALRIGKLLMFICLALLALSVLMGLVVWRLLSLMG